MMPGHKSVGEKVYDKLRYGGGLVCPKCGSRDFRLETKIWLTDYLRSNEDGSVEVSICTEVYDMVKDLTLDDVDEIFCANCDTKIPKKQLEGIPSDKVRYV